MARRAFLGVVVIRSLLGVTCAAEAAGWRQPCNRRRRVTSVAALVRGYERRVGRLWLRGSVTRRAIPAGCVMILVTIPARCLRGSRCKRDRRGVTVPARSLGMYRVAEFHGPRSWRMSGNGDDGRRRYRCRILAGLMTRRTA